MKKEIIFTDRFLITKKQIIYQETLKSEYFICIYKSESNFKLETYCDGISELNDGVFLRYNDGTGCIFNDKEIIKIKDVSFLYPKEMYYDSIVIFRGNIFEREYGVFKFKSHNFLFQRDFFGTDCIKNNILGLREKKIICYNLNLETLWQVDFSYPNYIDGFESEVEVKIERFIGIYNNELWIQFSNNRLLVLNIFNGNEIFYIDNVKSIFEPINLKLGDIFLDEISGKIKILAYKYYIEIDLLDKKIEIKKEFEDGWSIGNGRFYEGDKYVYFCGTENVYTKKSIGKNTTGIFNTEKCEIEWFYTLEDDEKFNFFVDVPQANDTYFGVRASGNKLYLFERNE